MPERSKFFLASTVLIFNIFLIATPAHAVPDDSCGWNPPKSLYNYKFSMTPEEFSDKFFEIHVLPRMPGDVQSVWRRSLSENSNPTEIINEHIDDFYDELDDVGRVKLQDVLFYWYDLLKNLKLMIIKSELSDFDTDLIAERIRQNKSWNTAGKSADSFSADFVKRVERLERKRGASGNLGVARAYFETQNDMNLLRGVSPNSITTSGSCFENEIYITESNLRSYQYRTTFPLIQSELTEFVNYAVKSAKKRGNDEKYIDRVIKTEEEDNKYRTLTDYLLFKLGVTQSYSIMMFKWQGDLYTEGYR